MITCGAIKVIFVFLGITLFLPYIGSTIVWKPEKLFTSPDSWEDKVEPCYLDKIVFPSDFDAALTLPHLLDIGGIVLPRTGALVFRQRTNTTLTEPGTKLQNPRGSSASCKSKNNMAYFKKPDKRFWFDPGNWERTDLLKHETFTLHESGVPCRGEHIQIKDEGALSIDLQNSAKLMITSLEFRGENLTRGQLRNFLQSEMGQMFFKNGYMTEVVFKGEKYCNCHDPLYLVKYKQTLCPNVESRCETANCWSPVRPIGHCCNVCGTMVHFDYHHCDANLLARVRRSLSDAIEDQKLGGKLSFSARFDDLLTKRLLQIVIKEERGGEQLSSEFFNKYIAKNKLLFDNHKMTIFASMESVTSAMNTIWMMIFLTLLFVVGFFGIVYTHYVGGGVRFITYLVGRAFHSPSVFARFENNPVEVDAHGQVVVNVAFDSVSEKRADDGGNIQNIGGATAFDNPMFKGDDTVETGTEMSVSSFEEGMTHVSLELPKENE